jgi:predicted MPP superfamily phosphohydrolase
MPINQKIILLIFVTAVFSIYLVEAILLSRFIYKRTREKYRRVILTKSAVILHLIAIAGILCLLYGYFIEPHRIEVKNITVQTDKLKDTSFRIVQFSDLHCDKKDGVEKTVIKIINNLKPDIIVFTGDGINRPFALPLFKETMKNLEAPLGKFAVYGNWETMHWPGLDYYSQTGFELLEDKTVSVQKNNETITISGLNCNYPQSADSILRYLSNKNFNIFLFHFPDLADYMVDYSVDLYLCGHTHGGQIAIPFYGALITMSKSGKKYEAGQYNVGHTIVYVNRGIGMDAYPPRIRLLSRPEITVFDVGPVK